MESSNRGRTASAPGKPSICIVSPALGQANNGNAHTAERWQRFLAPVADVTLTTRWTADMGCDALIALHARRSAGSVDAFRQAHPHAGIAVVLTGTDLYRDVPQGDAQALHSLECADELVVLQDRGPAGLAARWAAKSRVIVQSARLMRRPAKPEALADGALELIAIGHLRDEKDPLTLMRAAEALPADARIGILHIGRSLDTSLEEAARRTMAQCPRYRWIDGLPHAQTQSQLARADALVHMSRMEGGANVVIEAVRSGVPVLASAIDGNLGLLGDDYAGTFPVGDAAALAALMRRFAVDADFRALLRRQCDARAPLFASALERSAVRRLARDLFKVTARGRLNHP